MDTQLQPSDAPATDRSQAVLSADRLSTVKRAFTTRHVAVHRLVGLDADPAAAPAPGDLVLARVQRIGKHASLELTTGRRSALFVGDEVVVAYAARYAPDQFEAEVPADLGPCHLAASGGVAARVISRHGAVSAPTELLPLGLVVDANGQRVNMASCALPPGSAHGPRPLTIASLGTSMNAGKTTSAAHLIRGLVRAGLRVGGAKITGTGSGNDPGLLRDAGACLVLDFTDAGYASTFGLQLDALVGILHSVQAAMAAQAVDVLVMEVADGLLQRETEMLLRSQAFSARVDASVFSSGEAMGAIAGARWLEQQGLPLLGLAGSMTRSPLARREAEQATGLRTLDLPSLGDPTVALGLMREASTLALGGAAA